MQNNLEADETYTKRNKRKVMLLLILIVLVVAAALLITPLGSGSLGVEEVVEVILSKIPFLDIETDLFNSAIIWDIRLPRIAMAVVSGIGLALSGTAMQGALRNPLASPFTLGISSAACFGGAVAMFFGAAIAGSGKFAIIVTGFLFGLGALFLIYAISQRRGASPETVILCGIALMYMFMAMTSALSMGGMLGFLLWGTLMESCWVHVQVVFVVLLIVAPLLLIRSWDMNALALGGDVAQGVGVNIRKVRLTSVILATLMVSSIVAFTGLIGFVCLIAPYIAQRLMGNDYRFIYPCAGLIGALLLLGTDTIAGNMVESMEIPVALLTTMIGVPFLLYLALSRKEWA